MVTTPNAITPSDIVDFFIYWRCKNMIILKCSVGF